MQGELDRRCFHGRRSPDARQARQAAVAHRKKQLSSKRAMALSDRLHSKCRNRLLLPNHLRSFIHAKGWAEITCWCALRTVRVQRGLAPPSDGLSRHGESATPCLPRSVALSLRAHSCPPAPRRLAHEPPARTNRQHRMQTCFVNGCGSDQGRAILSVFFFHRRVEMKKKDRNSGATCYRLPLAAFFHAENEARLLPQPAFTLHTAE